MSTLKVNKIIPTAGVPTGGGGGVIQTIYASTASEVSTNSSSFVDTGLSGSITPTASTSKVLIMADLASCLKDGDTYFAVQVLRGSTVIGKIDESATYTNSNTYASAGSISCHILDTPGAGTHTYKLQFRSVSGSYNCKVQTNSSLSTMILQEISA